MKCISIDHNSATTAAAEKIWPNFDSLKLLHLFENVNCKIETF